MPQITRRTNVIDVDFHDVRPSFADRARVAWAAVRAVPPAAQLFVGTAAGMLAYMALTEPAALAKLDTYIASFGFAAVMAALTLGPDPSK